MNNEENMKEVSMVTLDELVSGITNHNKLMTLEARIKSLEAAGNNLAFLMLNGSTDEMRKAIWDWRELVPTKKDNE
jgi:hypothetical protein